MILQKKTINNIPTLVPLTADTGSGVPVGTIHGFYKKGSYPGYLYLDGSTFDETLYPALYAYLGTNVLPDYREFVLVGAEQNSTSATIAAHDVFTQGQEKDDQLQEHTHYIEANNLGHYDKFFNSSGGVGNVLASLQYTGAQSGAPEFRAGEFIQGRHGTTTRTKEKAVFWYIKATTGISESEATDVLNLYNEQNSYSTSEINTGKKWIDGKPIYRKVMQPTTQFTVPANDWITINSAISLPANIGQLLFCEIRHANNYSPWIAMARYSSGNLQVYSPHGIEMYTTGTVIIEYTKA
jgi:hypothetical protein